MGNLLLADFMTPLLPLLPVCIGIFMTTAPDILVNSSCTIPRRDSTTLTIGQFHRDFWRKQAVILYNLMPQSDEFLQFMTFRNLAKLNGVRVPVSHKSDLLGPLPLNTPEDVRLMNLSWIAATSANVMNQSCNSQTVFDGTFFRGHKDRENLDYWFTEPEQFYGLPLSNNRRPLILSMGGAGTGLTFHKHASACSLLVHGKKRWYLYHEKVASPPGGLHPGTCTSEWIEQIAPTLRHDELPLTCEQGPNELVYVPEGWLHATQNIKPTLSVSLIENGTSKTSALALYFEADGLMNEGKPKEAIRKYKACVRMRPRFAEAWNSLGVAMLFVDGEDDTKGLKAIYKSLKLNPLHPGNYKVLGRSLKILWERNGHTGQTKYYRRGMKALKIAHQMSKEVREKKEIRRIMKAWRDNLIKGNGGDPPEAKKYSDGRSHYT